MADHPLKPLFDKLLAGRTLSRDESTQAFELIMGGSATPVQISALLAMLQVREPTIDEIVGAVRVMRAKVSPVVVPPGLRVIDNCGMGGTGSRTFNISTTAALVAAAAARPHGVAVAKHGSTSVTSRSGSSQFLEAMGVNVMADGATQTRCLDEAGICFCFAPRHHPAMRYAAPVRAELGFRTLFNMLGPLTNPAGAKRQVLGVFRRDLTEPVAEVLRELGAEAGMVVHGTLSDGTALGELVTCGRTRISRLHNGRIETWELDAIELGLPAPQPQELYVNSPQESAAAARGVLAGRPGSARDIVCLNAAAALVVADVAADLAEGLTLARQAIDSGAAARALAQLVALTASRP